MKQYTLLTNSGINKLLKTASDGSKIALKEIVVSDYDGELSEQTASIPNEKYRGAINAITIDESDNNILDVDAIIPPEVGGFYIKTAGIYCDDGSLFAVARLADTYKPLLNEGSSKDITLNFKLQIANASESIILKVDNNIVLATRKWCEKMFLGLKDKIDAYTKQESDDKFALKTEVKRLPAGDYNSWDFWRSVPAGRYWHIETDGSNPPTIWAFVEVVSYAAEKDVIWRIGGEVFILHINHIKAPVKWDRLIMEREFQCSKAQNGYTKLPNGLILQWGTTTTMNVIFPIAFNKRLNVSLTSAENECEFVAAIVGEAVIENPSNTGFNIGVKRIAGTPPDYFKFYWFAIGY